MTCCLLHPKGPLWKVERWSRWVLKDLVQNCPSLQGPFVFLKCPNDSCCICMVPFAPFSGKTLAHCGTEHKQRSLDLNKQVTGCFPSNSSDCPSVYPAMCLRSLQCALQSARFCKVCLKNRSFLAANATYYTACLGWRTVYWPTFLRFVGGCFHGSLFFGAGSCWRSLSAAHAIEPLCI